MSIIYETINNLIASFFTQEAITTYQVYINDISFILTLFFIVVITAVPLVVVWNIISSVCFMLRPKAETRGSKKRRTFK